MWIGLSLSRRCCSGLATHHSSRARQRAGCICGIGSWVAIKSTNLRKQGFEVDIKADGGLVIVPSSFNPRVGKEYEFEKGSWDDLARLPPFRVEALAAPPSNDQPRGESPPD